MVLKEWCTCPNLRLLQLLFSEVFEFANIKLFVYDFLKNDLCHELVVSVGKRCEIEIFIFLLLLAVG